MTGEGRVEARTSWLLDAERPAVADLLEGAGQLVRLGPIELDRLAQDGEARCDVFFVHFTDLAKAMPRGKDATEYLTENFPPEKVRGGIWVYSGEPADMGVEETGSIHRVEYEVPRGGELPRRFLQLIETLDPQFARQLSSGVELAIRLSVLDVLCQEWLAVVAFAGAGSPSWRTDNLVYDSIDEGPGAELVREHLSQADDGPDAAWRDPQAWLAPALAEEPLLEPDFWRSLADEADRAADSLEVEAEDAYAKRARRRWGAESHQRMKGCVTAVARLVHCLQGEASTGRIVPEELIDGPAMPQTLDDWYGLILSAHVGYFNLASALVGA